MALIKGTDVTLVVKTESGVDDFNQPIYTESQVVVNDVLVGEPTTEAITTATDLYGKVLRYVLGIPKGDTHDWKDTDVIIFGERYRTFGDVIKGIEENVPTRWHNKVMVEKYE